MLDVAGIVQMRFADIPGSAVGWVHLCAILMWDARWANCLVMICITNA